MQRLPPFVAHHQIGGLHSMPHCKRDHVPVPLKLGGNEKLRAPLRAHADVRSTIPLATRADLSRSPVSYRSYLVIDCAATMGV